jgi:TIGR03009 family protein
MKRVLAAGLMCLWVGTAHGQTTGPQPYATPAGGEAAVTTAPFAPLSPEFQKFLDDVLNYWEQRSKSIERYRCTFERWEYDPVFGPRDTFKTYSTGLIKYSAPDKGLFQVEDILHYTPPAKQGDKPTYRKREGESGEHWICNGTSIFEHDHKNQQLIERELPPQMHGKAITEGPLPFLFGAEAQKIKQRYWIRPLRVPDGVKEYWLEAWPKLRKDAANYQKIHVIIDQAEFLPKGLVIFDPNFDSRESPARTTFTFSEREMNWSIALQQLNIWNRYFYEPKTPLGWKKIVERYDAPPEAQVSAPSAVDNGNNSQSQRPGTAPLRR